MHHDRVDAVVEALHRRRAGRGQGEDAAHLALQVGRASGPRGRGSSTAALPGSVCAEPLLEQGEQAGVAVVLHRDRLDHRAAELGREPGDVDREALRPGRRRPC